MEKKKSDQLGKVMEMLTEHQSNLDKYNRLKNDETIREWQNDYLARKESGGILAVSAEVSYGDSLPKSIEETLLMEQENVLGILRALKLRIQFVKLLLLSIREDYVKLIKLRYFQKLTVGKVCEAMYCSRSTFYRIHDQVMEELVKEYDRLMNYKKADDKNTDK